MSVWALGLNHHTAPLDLRGRFAFAIDQVAPTLTGLRASLSRQPEATLLSTCNRTEIYCAGEHADLEHTIDWLARNGGGEAGSLRLPPCPSSNSDPSRSATVAAPRP